MEKKCNCKEPYDAELFQGGYPYCPIHDNKPEPPATPEWELINRIVSQWGNAVEMPNMEQWLKDYAAKTQPGVVWVKGAKGFPVMKRVVAKFKHYDDPLRDWVAGFASSSTGETITFDWGVSSITLDINHERWDMLYWLDESAAGREDAVEEGAIAFADWGNNNVKGFDPMSEKWVYGKDEKRYTTAELYTIFKQQKEK